MGLFWDLIQQGQISSQSSRADSLESRLATLERELNHTQQLLNTLLQRLEDHCGEDINRDGRIG